MNKAKRLGALLLAVIMLTCTACGDEEAPKRKKKVVVVTRPGTSQGDNVSEDTDSSSDSDYDYTVDTDYSGGNDDNYDDYEETEEREKRELYEKEEEYTEKYVPEYTVTQKSWNGPKGYVIVYPKGNTQLKFMAQKLKKYFSEKAGVDLNIADDSTKASAKEILVGDTNRQKSKLKETQYAVSLKSNKLFFESGNFNGVMKAVKWFISLDYSKNKVNLLDGKYEFDSAKKTDNGTYKFVWGDDFDGDKLDTSFWHLKMQMDSYGYTNLDVVDDEDHIFVENGLLKMLSGKYLNPRNANIKYNATYAVCSEETVNFQYGYLEMRARYPVKLGAWPSWWLTGGSSEKTPAGKAFPSTDDPANIGNIYKTDFVSEVDILEYTACVPNLHRWFYDGGHDALGAVKALTGYGLLEKDSYVYHTFAFEWNYNEMKMYGDGVLFNTFDLNEAFNKNESMMDFRNPMQILFNNHVLPNGVPEDCSSMPYEYFVDYIRLYQKDGEGGIWFMDND